MSVFEPLRSRSGPSVNAAQPLLDGSNLTRRRLQSHQLRECPRALNTSYPRFIVVRIVLKLDMTLGPHQRFPIGQAFPRPLRVDQLLCGEPENQFAVRCLLGSFMIQDI